jgi:hypothetical protein
MRGPTDETDFQSDSPTMASSQLEIRRFPQDDDIGAQPLAKRCSTRSANLLLDDSSDVTVTGGNEAQVTQKDETIDLARQCSFHVRRAPAVQHAVSDHSRIRRVSPGGRIALVHMI